MEDDLKKMEEDLKKMEDDPKKNENGRQSIFMGIKNCATWIMYKDTD